MSSRPSIANPPRVDPPDGGILGVEAGGTRTIACWIDSDGTTSRRVSFGPANLRLTSDEELIRLFRSIARAFPRPAAIGIGMAGARTGPDQRRIVDAASHAWPGTPCHATNDLETAFAAAELAPHNDRLRLARVLVLSGTGSCCFGRGRDGRSHQVGGWGHLLGDQGSAYDIGILGLREVLRIFDFKGTWGPLGRRVLTSLHLNDPHALIAWVHAATKADVAALAPEVFAAAREGDRLARAVLDQAALGLADAAAACARRLRSHGEAVDFVLAGGVFQNQPAFARRVRTLLERLRPGCGVRVLQRPGAEGAAELARRRFANPEGVTAPAPRATKRTPGDSPSPIPSTIRRSPTERRNPRSMRLDRLTLRQGIDLMLSSDARVPAALRREQPAIERALRLIVRAFRAGGRLLYVGAGTSGRLGILDASECPPTFRTPPDMVQALIAGGPRAVFEAVEGAEDDLEAGSEAIQFRAIGRRDVVVGIAASGTTPFVWGALSEAKRRGAATVLVCFNPHLRFKRDQKPTVVIAARIGPEILTGSTRLKAGTATKLLLNLFTTLAMVRLGKVVSNLMVDVQPSNVKLRRRAVGITRALSGATEATAIAALDRAGWRIKEAVRALNRRPTQPPGLTSAGSRGL